MSNFSKQTKNLIDYIYDNIKQEFEEKHLTGNLMKSMYITQDNEGYHLHIPAEIYDIEKFWKEGVVVKKNTGSYASKLDTEGSEFDLYWKDKETGKWKHKHMEPRNHKGFVDDAIDEAIRKVVEENQWQITRENH